MPILIGQLEAHVDWLEAQERGSSSGATARDRGALPSSSGPKLGQLHLLGSGAGHLFSIRLCDVDVRLALVSVPGPLMITYS